MFESTDECFKCHVIAHRTTRQSNEAFSRNFVTTTSCPLGCFSRPLSLALCHYQHSCTCCEGNRWTLFFSLCQIFKCLIFLGSWKQHGGAASLPSPCSYLQHRHWPTRPRVFAGRCPCSLASYDWILVASQSPNPSTFKQHAAAIR